MAYKANVGFMPAVESISRKFALRKDTCSTKNFFGVNKFMGAGVRKYNVIGYGSGSVNYFFMRKNPRLSGPTSSELTQRSAFTDGVQWAAEALKDLTARTHNQQVYRAVRENPDLTVGGHSMKGVSSMYGMLRRYGILLAIDQEELPSNHQLPDPA